ncbi:hypothetical protein [Moraxella lacunata]
MDYYLIFYLSFCKISAGANYICPVLNLDFGVNKLPLYVQILKYILI